MQGKELIKHICTEGTPAEKRLLFEFDDHDLAKVLAKFQLFSRTFFTRYFQQKSAPFHKQMVEHYLRSYLLNENWMELAFRGAAKTSLLELVIVFVLLNDTKARKKYIKILSRDLKNSVKLVTGIYNKLIELEAVYGDVFVKDGKKKQEERQDSFLMRKGVQVSAGTVGMAQRGHKQDAYRPDWCHEVGTEIYDDGQWLKVENHKSFRGYRFETGVTLKLNPLPKTETVTNEHKYWVKSFKKKNNKNVFVYEGWKKAKDITNKDFIGLPIDQTVIPIPTFESYLPVIERNEKGQVINVKSSVRQKSLKEAKLLEFWWLVGLWWGDGTLATKNKKPGSDNFSTISLAVANSQPEILKKVTDIVTKLGRKYTVANSIGCKHVIFSHSELARFLRTWYLGGNSQKKPPQWVESIDHAYQAELMKGYISADGFFDKKAKCIRISSVSLQGLYAARRILARLNIPASIRLNNLAGEAVICGVPCKTQNKYDLRFRENAHLLGFDLTNQSRYAIQQTFIADGILWSKVMKISVSEKTLFCPIMTKTHDYITHFGLSHNCIFEDIEDRTSISSQAITTTTIENCDEALTGGAIDYSFVVNGNYISEDGVVEWFKRMSTVNTNITPVMDDAGEPTWSAISKSKIEELKSKSLDFNGEFLCNPQRGGNKYFNVAKIEEDLTRCTEPLRLAAGIKYWDKYKPYNSYGIGGDTSEGKGLDSNAMCLWDFTTGTLVASFYDNQIRPDAFAHEMVRVGREFGNCILAPEINNTSGGMVIQVIKDADYPNIHRKTLTDKIGTVLTTSLGWHTNSKTKPQILAEFARDYDNGLIKISDAALLKEMRSFNINDMDDQPASALATRHFDLLMAAAIGWAMRRYASPAESYQREDMWGDYGYTQV